MATSLTATIDRIAISAKKACLQLQGISEKQINKTLIAMAELLASEKTALQRVNKKDVAAAREKGLSSAMIDRLTLSDKTISSMITGLKEVAALSSPVGKTYDERKRPNDLVIYKMQVPIGVVAIIYESRPNVTVDAAAICLKSGNAVILRGGSEAFHSNKALAALFGKALAASGLPAASIQFIPTTDRTAIELLLKKSEQIDLVIPRGGEALIRMVTETSLIPVIKHYNGICHIFISQSANLKKAIDVVVNAKVQRPGTCNAMETLLLDAKLPLDSRKSVINALLKNGVTLFGDSVTMKLSKQIQRATVDNWKTEYLDLRLSVRTVASLEEAIDHINTFGSRHTDAIITESKKEAEQFIVQVDSASVMVNASTRFADGGEYGMGCEIGISTEKLHARGPMGIADLTTYKWVVKGSGQLRT